MNVPDEGNWILEYLPLLRLQQYPDWLQCCQVTWFQVNIFCQPWKQGMTYFTFSFLELMILDNFSPLMISSCTHKLKTGWNLSCSFKFSAVILATADPLHVNATEKRRIPIARADNSNFVLHRMWFMRQVVLYLTQPLHLSSTGKFCWESPQQIQLRWPQKF